MSFRQLFPRIAALAVLCAACQEQKSSANAGADTSAASVRANAAAVGAKANEGFRLPEARSGQLTLVDAEVFFLPCGSRGKPEKLDDATKGDAIAILRRMQGGARPLVALVRLDGNRLLQVRFASSDAGTCNVLPSRATVDVNGNEPFWAVQISGDLATYRTPHEMKGVVFQGGEWTRLDTTRWRYVARRTGEGIKEISLEFTEGRCVDTMAGAVYPFSAKLTRGDSTLKGCALEGRGSYAPTADTARAAGPSSAARGPSPLSGTAWRLAELNGEPAIDNVKATLEFARGGKASGSGSCNRFSGSVEVAADSIKFGALVTTRMACAAPAMRQESAYLEALAKAERYSREGNAMLVHLKGGGKPLRFEPL